MTSSASVHTIQGHLDGLVDNDVIGWAFDAQSLTSVVELEVLVDGKVLGHAPANLYREDLSRAGVGNGRCAFKVHLPLGDFRDGKSYEIRVRVRGTKIELGGSPTRVYLGAADGARDGEMGIRAADTVLAREGSLEALRERLARRGRLAIMAAFQPPGRAPSYLVAYLEALRACDVAVVLVDTTPGGTHIDPDLAPVIVRRQNVGLDFASWFAGIDQVRDVLEGAEEVLLANDSVFGPLHDLEESWSNPRLEGADFWGLTDSWSISYHLQSYFIVLRRSALELPVFWDFMRSYGFPVSKHRVIQEGEVGLTTALLRAGLRSAVTCPYDEVAREWLDQLPERLQRARAYPENAIVEAVGMGHLAGGAGGASVRQILETAHNIRRGVALNPSHHLWDTLVERFRYPFLKRELLQVNPAEIPFVSELGRVVGPTGYDVNHIRDAARRAREVRVVTI